MRLARSVVLVGAGFALLAKTVSAAPVTIVEFTNGPAATGPELSIGQSMPTGETGPWDHLVFNWFADRPGHPPSALGTVFLLTQEYLGTAANLGTAPGLLASAVGSGGFYTFDPSITIQPNSRYFFYADAPGRISGHPASPYTAGESYFAPPGQPFILAPSNDVASDMAFRLRGELASPATVPEPASLLLLGTGAAALVRRRR